MRWLLCLFLPCAALSLEFTGEALYWRPAQDYFDFVARPFVATPDTSLKRDITTLEPTYDWGFAACGLMRWPDEGFSVRAAGRYIDTLSRARGSGSLVSLLFIPVERGRATLSTRYWALDLRGSLLLFCGPDGYLEAFAGARYARLRRELALTGLGADIADADGLFHARFWGLGPQLGLNGTFYLWRALGVTGSLGVAPLIGERSFAVFQLSSINDLIPFVTEGVTVIVPALESRVGFSTRRSNGCFFWCGEVGYQLDFFWQPFSLFHGSAAIFGNRSPASFGYAGPYTSFTLGF